MKNNTIYIFILISINILYGYTNLYPSEVYSRLLQGDSLLLLDVREVSEYKEGHIAEPDGQLPLTPVNMAYSSNVLSAEYQRLPKNIDILV